MKKILITAFALTIGFFFSTTTAQTTNTATNEITLGMPQVSLLGSNTPAINLTLSPLTAGESVSQSISNETARILVSSVIAETQTRTMTAKVTTGTIPAGTYLNVVALQPNTHFIGTAGTIEPEITLNTTSDQTIISGIGTCYSGTSADDGYGLKYTYGIPTSTDNYDQIRATTGVSVTVTLTMTAAI